ncbi:MAG: hypothetical protein U0359_12245 [Byssovorax sp.]
MAPALPSDRLLRAARLLVLGLAAASSSLTGGCESKPAPPSVTAEDLSPVPAPDGLLAELCIPSPEASWGKARAIVGGPAAFLPPNFGGLAATLLRLPVMASAEIDDKVPVLGAIVKKPAESYAFAIGLHVKAGDRFVDQLTKGPEARFVSARDPLSHVQVISLKEPPSAPPPVVIGVLGNYLIAAQNAADLHALGPYVARTLPTHPVPKEDAVVEVPESALSGPIAEAMKKQWNVARQGLEGASPSTLPLTATMDTVLGVLTDAKHARLAIELGEDAVRSRFLLTPKSADGPASKALALMSVGDASPLLDLPQSSLVAITFRESADARALATDAQTEALARLFGGEPSAEDKAAIGAALKAEAAARGDWMALGIALDPTGPSAMVRAPIADQDRMDKALKQLLDLARLPAAKARLAEAGFAISASKTVVENLPGDVQKVRIDRLIAKDAPPAKSAEPLEDKKPKETKGKKDDKAAAKPATPINAPPTAIDVLYLIGKDMLVGAVGYDSAEALRTLVRTTNETSLGHDPIVKAAVTGLGNESSFVVLADPIRLVAARAGKPAPSTPAPTLLAIGKTGSPAALTGRLDIAVFAIQELVKHRGAF